MAMQITTINVNGIRAATKIRSSTNRGFLPWLFDVAPDVVLLQEIRATDAESRTVLAPALDTGWYLGLTTPGTIVGSDQQVNEEVAIGFAAGRNYEIGRASCRERV